MLPTEIGELEECLTECFAVLGKKFNPQGINWWARALRPYGMIEIRSALMEFATKAEYPPKPKDLLEKLSSGNVGPVRRLRCCFEADGQRCPLMGYYDLHEGRFDGNRLCPEHNNLRADFKGGIAYMHMVLESELPAYEHANDRMMREFAAGKRDPKAALDGTIGKQVQRIIERRIGMVR